MQFDGQSTLCVTDKDGHQVIREPYDGKLVVTAHAVEMNDDPGWPDEICRQLERFMREHKLSRLEAYWNAVPPLDEGRKE